MNGKSCYETNPLTDLQGATLSLDYRVTNLEENGGDSGNITELETRVSDLEVATSEQETRITTNQENIQGKISILQTICQNDCRYEKKITTQFVSQASLAIYAFAIFHWASLCLQIPCA